MPKLTLKQIETKYQSKLLSSKNKYLNDKKRVQENAKQIIEKELLKIEKKYNLTVRKIEEEKKRSIKNLSLLSQWKEPKVIKKKVPTISSLRNKALQIWQKIARRERRDENGIVTCISSGIRMKRDECDGGHFKDKKHRTKYDFDLNNIRPQCKQDNIWGNGEKSKYRRNLVNIIWEELVYEIENAKRYNRTRQDYERLIVEWNKRLNNIN